MGFESPAKDYIEETLTVTKLCRMDANSRVVKTDSGYAILDLSLRPQPGDIVLIRYDGITDFGRLQGQSFITRDGEAIEDYLVTGDGAPNLLKHSVEKAHTRWAHCYFFKRFISHPGGFILILTCSPMLALL
ncbi:hypothetical protein [Raoultella planticola]|uniref:hypothetical protein n=1 Tax=Raoultella planticola TaxID=575 RepID=UPI0034E4FB8F